MRNCGIWNVLFFSRKMASYQSVGMLEWAEGARTRGFVGVGSSCGLMLFVQSTSLPPGILYHLIGCRLTPWDRKSGRTPRKRSTSRVRGWLRATMRQASETVGIRGADLDAQTTLLEMQRVRLVDDAYWNTVLYEGERESEACGACTDLWGI